MKLCIQGRQQAFEVHTRKMPLAGDVDLGDLAGRTLGYTGADIRGLCQEVCPGIILCLYSLALLRFSHGKWGSLSPRKAASWPRNIDIMRRIFHWQAYTKWFYQYLGKEGGSFFLQIGGLQAAAMLVHCCLSAQSRKTLAHDVKNTSSSLLFTSAKQENGGSWPNVHFHHTFWPCS